MKTLSIVKVADGLFRIEPPVLLEEKPTMRRLFFGELGKGEDQEWHVRGTIVVEKKGRTGWQPDGVDLTGMKAGDLRKLELKSEHVRNLLAGLEILADAAEQQGASIRPVRKLVVAKENEVVRVVERDHKAIIEQLIAQDKGRDFWQSLTLLSPDIATEIAEAEIHRRRKAALETFERELLSRRWKEPEWEEFFCQNTWIFGYGLRYQFLGLLQKQAHYGGTAYTGKGGQRGEFMMASGGDERFTVLVEIKKPESPIFSASVGAYRNAVPGFSTEFVNAISQVQVNAQTWEGEGSKTEGNRELLGRAGIHTISPRSILIFGTTSQLDSGTKITSFSLFRRSLHAPDIITFDELLFRARFIVTGLE